MTHAEIANRENGKTRMEFIIQDCGRVKLWYARQVGINVRPDGSSSIHKIVKGQRIPGAGVRKKLADLLGESVDRLWKLDNRTGEIVARRIGDVD